MGKCEYSDECPFFKGKIANRPFLSSTYRNYYCHKDYSKCARHMVAVASGKAKIPFDLFPDQVNTAGEIIDRGESK
jgi:hypothetical protein